MARELKVYGFTMMTANDEAQRLGMRAHSRQCRAIVAATTKKEAAEKFGISASAANGFMTETGNAREIKIATAKPGQVFAFSLDGPSDKENYIEIERKPHVAYKRNKRPSFEEIMARRAAAEAEALKRKFTREELAYMVEMFGGANNPVAASIAVKAGLQLAA